MNVQYIYGMNIIYETIDLKIKIINLSLVLLISCNTLKIFDTIFNPIYLGPSPFINYSKKEEN